MDNDIFSNVEPTNEGYADNTESIVEDDFYSIKVVEGGYGFTTDNGLNYLVYLSNYEGSFFNEERAFYFGFVVDRKNETITDNKVSKTICQVLKEYFTRDNSLILLAPYSSENNKAKNEQQQQKNRSKYRSKLFDQWYSKHAKDEIIKHNISIEEFYLSFLLHRTHPNLHELMPKIQRLNEYTLDQLVLIGKD